MNFCPQCGSKIPGEASKFCGECGSALPIATDELTLDASQQAAAAGDTGAMFNLGVLAKNEGDVTGAQRWYEQAAAVGHPIRRSVSVCEELG